MRTARAYHHGDLRAALVAAAQAAVEADGPEAVSLRDIAQSLGVSTAAPYRHFPDRRALLAEVAALGFRDLCAAYAQAQATATASRSPTATGYSGLEPNAQAQT